MSDLRFQMNPLLSPRRAGAGAPRPVLANPSRRLRWRSLVCTLAVLGGGLAAQDASPGLSLDDAIHRALANNRNIKVDAFTRGVGKAGLLAAYGAFDPSLSFQRSYSQSYSASYSSTVTGMTVPASTFFQSDNYSIGLGGIMPWGLQYSIGGTASNQRGSYSPLKNEYLSFGGVQVTQPLLKGFGFSGSAANLSLRVAKANRHIDDLQYRLTVINTVTNVIVAYSDLAAAQAYLRTAQRSRDLAAGLVAENEKRFKVGSMSENDVISARAKVPLREEGILSAAQAVRDSDNRLRLLLGEHAFSNDGPLLVVDSPEPPELTLNLAEDLKKSYSLRPDFQQARYGLDQSRYREANARNQLLPQVDFVGSYGYSGVSESFAESRRKVADEDQRAYSAGVVVSIPLTFAQGRGNARAAKLQRKHDEENLELIKEQIALSVTAAAGQVETTRKRVESARSALDLAQKTQDAELKKLRVGASSTFEVLYLQEQAAMAEVNLAQALADQRSAVALYDREIGTTLERHHIVLSDR